MAEILIIWFFAGLLVVLLIVMPVMLRSGQLSREEDNVEIDEIMSKLDKRL